MILQHRHPGQSEGERRKADVLATLAARRELYVLRGRCALLRRMLEVGVASADDVRRAVTLPEDIDPRCFGSVPGPLARAGIIRRSDFRKSHRAERHASYITEWELIDREAAEAWLTDHPDPWAEKNPDAPTSGQPEGGRLL